MPTVFWLPCAKGGAAGSGKDWEAGRKREATPFLLPPPVAADSGLQEDLWQFEEYSVGLRAQQMLLGPNYSSNGHASSTVIIISQKLKKKNDTHVNIE